MGRKKNCSQLFHEAASWSGRKYKEIAGDYGYSTGYIKSIGGRGRKIPVSMIAGAKQSLRMNDSDYRELIEAYIREDYYLTRLVNEIIKYRGQEPPVSPGSPIQENQNVVRETAYVTVRLEISRSPEVEVNDVIDAVRCSLDIDKKMKAALVDYEVCTSGAEVEPQDNNQENDED